MSNNTKSQIGERIKSRIKALHTTAPEVAEKIGVSKDTLYGYQSGRISLPTERVAKLCEALNCDANYLICGNDDIKRKMGLDEDAARRFTTPEEWGVDISPRYKGESMAEYEERKHGIFIECGETLSDLIRNGLLPIIAKIHGIQCVWENGYTYQKWENGKRIVEKDENGKRIVDFSENGIPNLTFDEVARNISLYETGGEYSDDNRTDNIEIQERLYTDTIRAEKSIERLIERYISKSSEEGR